MLLDSVMYPHVVDNVIAHAIAMGSLADLAALRSVSKAFHTKVDDHLFDHLTLSHVEGSFCIVQVATPLGHHPALLDWPTADARGLYSGGCCVVQNMNTTNATTMFCPGCALDAPWRHTPLSARFKRTRVVDIIGATLMEGFKTLSSVFGTLDYLRFKPQWGTDVDMDYEEGMVWPKDMVRQTLRCGVRNVVWLGDLAHASGERCEALPVVPGAHYIYAYRRPPTLSSYLDYRLEEPDEAGRFTIIFHPPEVPQPPSRSPSPPPSAAPLAPAQSTAVRYTDLNRIEPYTQMTLQTRLQYTCVGLFDTPFTALPAGIAGREAQAHFLEGAREAVISGLVALRGHDDAARDLVVPEADAWFARWTTLSMDEYTATLGAHARAMILEVEDWGRGKGREGSDTE